MNLTGTGGMTTYLESSSGVSVNVTVCMGLYVVPGGILGVAGRQSPIDTRSGRSCRPT